MVLVACAVAGCSGGASTATDAANELDETCRTIREADRSFQERYTVITTGSGNAADLFAAIEENEDAIVAYYESLLPVLPEDLAERARTLLVEIQSPPELGAATFGHEAFREQVSEWFDATC